jgi:putative hydrolase of the HAD superfamily
MQSGALDLLLFDAAGTLIAPAEPVADVYCRIFANYGWKTDPALLKEGFRRTFAGLADPDFQEDGDGDAAERAWWRQVVAATALSAGIEPVGGEFEACFGELFSHYAAGSAWSVFPEVREVLGRLRTSGVKMAVVSNFDRRLHQVLAELGLTGYFDLILTSADVSARKPRPKLLEVAMAHFRAIPDTTRLVGDSEAADGGAARAAGMQAFILDRPRTGLMDFIQWLDGDFLIK